MAIAGLLRDVWPALLGVIAVILVICLSLIGVARKESSPDDEDQTSENGPET